jgi:O-antigen ligase
MGLFFSLVYLITAFLAPQTIFGEDLAQMHVELYIAVVALILTLFSAQGSGLSRMTQTWALIGLSAAACLSIVFTGWLGGGVYALESFLPAAAAFFMVAVNVKKKWQLQLVVALLFFAATFIILNGSYALYTQEPLSNYLLSQGVGEGVDSYHILRLRGLSFLNDPNDFAQFLVALIPLMFLFWRKGKGFTNVLLVYAPAAFLAVGMYLTHSRGGMLALLLVLIITSSRKIGLVPSLVTAAVLFVGLSAAGFTGGRDISASTGEDRMEAWSVGLNLLRAHPIFGVGFDKMSDYNNITAHNTVVVCAAELGLVGYFCFILFIFVGMRNAVVGMQKLPGDEPVADADELGAGSYRFGFPGQTAALSSPAVAVSSQAASVASPAAWNVPAQAMATTAAPLHLASGSGGAAPYGFPGLDGEPANASLTDDEIRRMSRLIVLSLAGFLAAGWFLSRAYTMVLYVMTGIGAVVYRMALERGTCLPPLAAGRAMKLAAGLGLVLLIVVYIIVRVDHFLPH